MKQLAKIYYQKCAWCEKEALDLFAFIWEETGDKEYICEECLRSVEGEFYEEDKDQKDLEEILSIRR